MGSEQILAICSPHSSVHFVVNIWTHYQTCESLRTQHRTEEVSRNSVSYSDIYSSDVFRQKEITELYTELLRTRDELMNSTPVAITGPVHSFARTTYIITE